MSVTRLLRLRAGQVIELAGITVMTRSSLTVIRVIVDLAVKLQVALQRFAKRWYQRRALRIFRDEANLTANPALWESIKQALSESKWFVILVSAKTAQSVWVNREIEWWLANRSSRRLLIVATGPGLAWDAQLGDWATEAPVPAALRGVLAQEPRAADLVSVARGEHRLKLPDDVVADIAAPIHGKPRMNSSVTTYVSTGVRGGLRGARFLA